MKQYEAPSVITLGTVSEQTLTAITKVGDHGDTIVINGVSIPVAGSYEP